MKKLLVAAVLMCFVGGAFAAVENIKVSGDINAEAISRDLSLGRKTLADNADEALISQIRLRFDADLTEGVSAVLRLISQETWGEDNADDLEIDLGYIELKEFLYDPLTLVIGKQNLRYGSGLVVGDPDTNQGVSAQRDDNSTGLPGFATDLSLRKSFDAARAILDYAPWTIDLVYAKLDESTTSTRRDDENLFGLNAAYDWSSYNGVTEIYFFGADRAPLSTVTDESDKVYAIGSRVQFDLNDNLTLGGEGAFQFGRFRQLGPQGIEEDRICAFAGILGVDYRFLNDYNSKLGFKYTHLSGDKTDNDNTHQAWQPMWEDQTPGELLNVLLDNSNAQIFSVSGSMMPREDITLGMLYSQAYLVQEVNTELAAGSLTYSPTLGPASGNAYNVKAGNHSFGQEIDVYAIYDYTEDVQIKLSGAYFNPGDFFIQSNDDSAMSVRAGLSVDF